MALMKVSQGVGSPLEFQWDSRREWWAVPESAVAHPHLHAAEWEGRRRFRGPTSARPHPLGARILRGMPRIHL